MNVVSPKGSEIAFDSEGFQFSSIISSGNGVEPALIHARRLGDSHHSAAAVAEPFLLMRQGDSTVQIITRDFNLAWDFRSVAWAATLLYNAQRAVCAGVVWGAALGLPLAFHGDARSATAGFCSPCSCRSTGWSCCLWLIWRGRSRIVFQAVVGLNLLAGVLIATGDPLLCLVKAFWPSLVPMEKPPLFSAHLVILLLKSTETTEWVTSRHGRRSTNAGNSSSQACRQCGTLISPGCAGVSNLLEEMDMSKLSQKERTGLFREKARNDANKGRFDPPGLSLAEKLGLTFLTGGLGAISFFDDETRDRKNLQKCTSQNHGAQLDSAQATVIASGRAWLARTTGSEC